MRLAFNTHSGKSIQNLFCSAYLIFSLTRKLSTLTFFPDLLKKLTTDKIWMIAQVL